MYTKGAEMLKYTITFLLFVQTSLSVAEPTPLVSKLMDTPASMFDIGLIKAQRQLDSLGKGYTISYDWDQNKFIIQTLFYGDVNPLICETESNCKDFLKSKTEEETILFCYPMDDKCSLFNIASEFSHSGYATKNFYNGKTDAESVKELRNLFYINTILIKKYNGVSKKITCERAIINAQTLCTDAVEMGKQK